jgi:hypothetical protein
MSDTSVVVQLSAQDAELVAAWQRARKSVTDFETAIGRVGKTGQRAGKEVKDSFDPIADSTRQVSGIIFGISTATGAAVAAARLLRAEWDAILQRKKEAQGLQVDVNSAFRRAAMVATEIPSDQLFQRVVSGANGVKPEELFLSIEAGISASGNIPNESVLRTALASAKLAPYFDQESRSAAITGSLTLQKAFGVKPEEALAGVMQSFVAARTETPGEFSRTLAPAAANLRALGGGKDSYEFLMSELVAFGQRAGDPTGRKTATNYINLARQYKEEAVSAGLVDRHASLEESLSAVRGSPKIQQKMLGVFADTSLGTSSSAMLKAMRKHKSQGGELSIEGRMFVAAMETLQQDQDSPENKTAEERRAARGKLLGLTPAAVEAIESQNERSSGTPYNVAANIGRAEKQARQRALLTDVKGGASMAVLEAESEASKIAGESATWRGIVNTLGKTNIFFGRNEEEFIASSLQVNKGRIDRLRSNNVGGANDEKINQLIELNTEIAESLRILRERPQKVEVTRDNRPDIAPRGSGATLLNEGGAR